MNGGQSGGFAGSLTKTDLGMLTLSGANTFTGATTVNGGVLVAGGPGALGNTGGVTINDTATLQLAGAGDRINDNANLVMNGGILNTAGLSEMFGSLLLPAGASILDLGNGASILHFRNSDAFLWGGQLKVYDWTGDPSGGGTDQLFFGNNITGLRSDQLAAMQFYSDAGTTFLGTGMILSDGEVVPDISEIPEPSTAATMLIMSVGLLALRICRRSGR